MGEGGLFLWEDCVAMMKRGGGKARGKKGEGWGGGAGAGEAGEANNGEAGQE